MFDKIDERLVKATEDFNRTMDRLEVAAAKPRNRTILLIIALIMSALFVVFIAIPTMGVFRTAEILGGAFILLWAISWLKDIFSPN